MNRLIIVVALFYSTFFFAQDRLSVVDTMAIRKNYFKVYFDNLPVVKYTFDFSAKKDNVPQLSIYNFNSRSNDVYFLQSGTCIIMSPRINLENNWIGSRKDSFNPYGTTNIGSAVVMGLITMLFEKQ
ncbi:hypothetical protein [Flavobacterium nackdongense]|uniref:Uncharacterized protein n=1 Tax=Flavobacterium nackdongense TaxID=2547394 RepID=A0A4P6Y717_9FLAO|nr:hypothetical protein [Flavobacterium nackdongense]QBN18266.1 hypothetical protein E1750_05405 [Flavobacterium nackdongense]